MRRARLSVLIAVMFASAANAQMPAANMIKEYPCYWVHGRYGVYNGSGIRRIWIIGTHRIVHMWDADETPLPAAMEKFQDEHQDQFLFGDFKICPLEPDKAGWSRHVRIGGARRLIFAGKPFP